MRRSIVVLLQFIIVIAFGNQLVHTEAPSPVSIFVVDDQELVSRFTKEQKAAIIKHARKADAFYPQVGGIGHWASGGVLVLEQFRPLIFKDWRRQWLRPLGACDSDEECFEATDEACKQYGHEGADEESVEISADLCSADCLENGAVALVACNTN